MRLDNMHMHKMVISATNWRKTKSHILNVMRHPNADMNSAHGSVIFREPVIRLRCCFPPWEVVPGDLSHSPPNTYIPIGEDVHVGVTGHRGNIEYDFPVAIVIVQGKWDRASRGMIEQLSTQYRGLSVDYDLPVIYWFQRDGVDNQNRGPYVVNPGGN